MVLGYFASAPVLVVPYQQHTSHFSHPHQHQHQHSISGSLSPSASLSSSPRTSIKRSRDDFSCTSDDDDNPGRASMHLRPTAAPRSRRILRPAYGSRMTRRYTDPAEYHIPTMQSFPTIASTLPTQDDDQADTTGCRKSLRLQAEYSSNGQDATIDIASRILSVGWTRISGDSTKEAAARGWSRYISNHFGLTDVEILLHSKSDQGYLARAFIGGSERYCRFSEDLREFQIIAVAPNVPASTPEQALLCAQQNPLPVIDQVFGQAVNITALQPAASESNINININSNNTNPNNSNNNNNINNNDEVAAIEKHDASVCDVEMGFV